MLRPARPRCLTRYCLLTPAAVPAAAVVAAAATERGDSDRRAAVIVRRRVVGRGAAIHRGRVHRSGVDRRAVIGWGRVAVPVRRVAIPIATVPVPAVPAVPA